MNQLMSTFVTISNLELLRRRILCGDDVGCTLRQVNAELETFLHQMAQISQSGVGFDYLAYSTAVRDVINAAPNTPKGQQTIRRVFGEYLAFQCAVLLINETPLIQERLEADGMAEWAHLAIDRVTLLPIAEQVIAAFEKVIADGFVLPSETAAETAELVFQSANIFELPLSSSAQKVIDWHLDDVDSGDKNEPRVFN